MANAGLFLAAALAGFNRSKQRKKEQEEQESEKKARLKLIEIQMDRERRLAAQEAKAEQAQIEQGRTKHAFFEEALNKVSGVQSQRLPGTGVVLGDAGAAPQPKVGLSDLLSDPEMLLKGIQAGVVSPETALKGRDIPEFEAKAKFLQANPWALQQERDLRAASATRIDTGDKMGKIPQGFALVSGPDGQPVLQRLEGGPQTPGQESLDKAFGTDAAAWVMAGGFADSQKSIKQLGEAKKRLEQAAEKNAAAAKNGERSENLTGPAVAKIPEFAKPLFNPAAVEVRDSVEEIVQRNLRLVLGAQFTEKEGERLIARSYNENLSETENAKRIGRLIDQISQAAQAKQEAVNYFSEHGSLEGFKGKLWTMADFDPDSDEAAPSGSTKAPSEMSDEEILKALGSGG